MKRCKECGGTKKTGHQRLCKTGLKEHRKLNPPKGVSVLPSLEKKFPVFKLKQNGKRIAVNPNHVTAIYADKEDVTDIYTLDCARSADAWDVAESFDSVVTKISDWVVKYGKN